MGATAAAHESDQPPGGRRRLLVPSIVSGLVLGVVGAVVVAVIVHALVHGSRRPDDTVVAGYVGWFIFFMIGIGAANYPVRWGLGRPETTHQEELELAGKDQGVWRYFRFCTDHKVVGIQYLVTVLVLFAVGGLASWMIRLQQAQSGRRYSRPRPTTRSSGCTGW